MIFIFLSCREEAYNSKKLSWKFKTSSWTTNHDPLSRTLNNIRTCDVRCFIFKKTFWNRKSWQYYSKIALTVMVTTFWKVNCKHRVNKNPTLKFSKVCWFQVYTCLPRIGVQLHPHLLDYVSHLSSVWEITYHSNLQIAPVCVCKMCATHQTFKKKKSLIFEIYLKEKNIRSPNPFFKTNTTLVAKWMQEKLFSPWSSISNFIPQFCPQSMNFLWRFPLNILSGFAVSLWRKLTISVISQNFWDNKLSQQTFACSKTRI